MRMKIGYFKKSCLTKCLILRNLKKGVPDEYSTGYPADTNEQFVNINRSYVAMFPVLSKCLKSKFWPTT